jgi:hypothetical protein
MSVEFDCGFFQRNTHEITNDVHSSLTKVPLMVCMVLRVCMGCKGCMGCLYFSRHYDVRTEEPY